ncbi:MAG TPA: outer membrane beta-barrel protein [Acidobacteriaceae bacterium]|nr:outer membrane beta-barrel protein [Acidobacteriaceae bacterium]
MHSLSRAMLATATLFLSLTGIAAAQTTAFGRQMAKIDFGISGAGALNKTVSGPVLPTGATNHGTVMSLYGSNTVGALGSIRYTAKPYFGIEFNYGWARYTENYSPAPNGSSLFQIQNTANETSFGYLITPPHPIFGFQPFVSAGAGTTDFKPTAGGGEGAPHQFRATYYYNVGLQKDVLINFGVRASFRENFFLAPDFGQNYLTIKQRTTTLQPTIGFYLRF